MAYPGMKAGFDWHVPFFDSMMRDHHIDSFAFNLHQAKPALEFNPDLEGLEIEWHPVVNQLFWSLPLDKLTLKYQGQETVLCEGQDECWVTPDSGSSALTAPSFFHNKLSEAWFPKGSECDSVIDDDLTLTYTINGLDYSLGWLDIVDEYRRDKK